MKYHFIVNPNSGHGSGFSTWKEAEQLLNQKQVEYSVYFTTGHLDAQKKAAELTADLQEETAVICVGGDGTIDEVLNGLNLDAPVVFGFIPSGSGNDLGRSLRMNGGVKESIKKIFDEPYITEMDYGVLEMTDGKSRRFAVSCGVGFDAAVCHALDDSKAKDFFNSLHLGKAGYTAIGFGEYLKAKPSVGYIIVDGEKKVDFKSIFFLSFQNHPYEGGGYHFAPNAVWNDGKIDVTAISTANKLKLFPVLIDKQNGVKENGFIRFYSCREVVVHLNNPLPVHSDGENMGRQTDFTVRCIHGQLRMFV